MPWTQYLSQKCNSGSTTQKFFNAIHNSDMAKVQKPLK